MSTPPNKLLTVKNFLQLEISHEQELQDIVVLAAEICQTQVALITFMDDDIQWIKFKVGADIEKNSRENAFCKHLIDKHEVLIVPNTLHDERFVNHAGVQGHPHIRFYAGAPLTTHDGMHLGTLCVFAPEPKMLSLQQQNLLRILAKQITYLLELEMSVKLLKEHVSEMNGQRKKIESSEITLRSFMDSSRACHILLGKNSELINFNKAGAEFLSNIYRREVSPGMIATEYLSPSFAPIFNTIFPEALAGASRSLEYLVKYADEGTNWWEITFSPAHNNDGDIIGVSINATNINERKLHTEKITTQNKALARIAHIQSHGLRKPVASILGLMNVIKAYDYINPKEYLQQIELAAKELDDTIHAIVRQTELLPK